MYINLDVCGFKNVRSWWSTELAMAIFIVGLPVIPLGIITLVFLKDKNDKLKCKNIENEQTLSMKEYFSSAYQRHLVPRLDSKICVYSTE